MLGLRPRLRNLLAQIITEDPDPQYGELDRLDGLGQGTTSQSGEVHALAVDNIALTDSKDVQRHSASCRCLNPDRVHRTVEYTPPPSVTTSGHSAAGSQPSMTEARYRD